MSSVELRSKTELTSIVGTENVYIQEAGSPYTVKRTLLNTIRSWLMTTPSSTVYKQASYAILDSDGYTRIEVDTTAGAVAITLPLMANNRARRIEIAFVKADASADVITVSPHATDANKLSNDLLGSIILAKVGDFIVVQESVNSGCWEVINERVTSQLRLDTRAGFGSTDNKIERFTNLIENVGNMFFENHVSGYSSNAKGLEITINRSGRYSFNWASSSTNGTTNQTLALSLNSSQLTTTAATITLSTILNNGYTSGNASFPISWSGYLKKGDVVRTHTDGLSSTAARQTISVSYLGQ